jgi:hypothetical protein
LDSKLGLAEAAMKAQAGNQARNLREQQGVGLGADAVNLYRGIGGMSQANLQSATAAGQTGFANQMAIGQQMQAGYGQAANINQSGSNMMNNSYQVGGQLNANDLAAYELKQQYGPAAQFGEIVGGLSGLAGSGGLSAVLGFAEGGAIPYRAEGGAATAKSPAAMPRPASQGIPPENQQVIVSPGEYIIPDDVARWEGEKKLQQIVNKAREERIATDQQRAHNQRSMGIPA